MTRLGCFADFHAGAYPGFADDRLAEQEAVLAQAVQVFNEAGVDAILFAGDATHRNKPEPAELLAFLRPLLAAEAPILAISGNKHDVGNTLGPIALDLLDKRVNGLIRLSRTPEIVPFGDLRVATLPWTSTQQLRANMNSGDPENIDQWAAEHLLTLAGELRDRIPDGCASVLLTHFAISGDKDGLSSVVREPVLPLEGLVALGFDAVVAGHFHRPQVLFGSAGRLSQGAAGETPPETATDTSQGRESTPEGELKNEAPTRAYSFADPKSTSNSGRVGKTAVSGSADRLHTGEPEPALILYCGSPYPLNFSEGDYEHGVWIVDVEPGFATARFVPLESRRFVTIDADLTWLPEGVDVTDWLIGHVQAVTA